MPLDRRRIVAESLGTFFLVLIGPGAVMVNAMSGGAITHVGVSLAFAFIVTAMIYTIGHISGAHLNPAVTIAFWAIGRFPRREIVPYVLAQCIGATLASAVLRSILGSVGQLGATLSTIATVGTLIVELLLSFVLMFVIMAVATDDRASPGFAPIAIGLTVGFCALMGGPLTGASMNPARSLGPALIGGLWDQHWLYWAGPIMGMLLAAHTYEWLRGTQALSHSSLADPATAPSRDGDSASRVA
jgi:aquaporin Z